VERVWLVAANGGVQPEQMFWGGATPLQISAPDGSICFKDAQPELRIAKRDLATGSVQNVFHSEKRLTATEGLYIHGMHSVSHAFLGRRSFPIRSGRGRHPVEKGSPLQELRLGNYRNGFRVHGFYGWTDDACYERAARGGRHLSGQAGAVIKFALLLLCSGDAFLPCLGSENRVAR
jgi:hypothetical protein